MGDFYDKTNYLIETKSLLKDRINSLGGSITSGTTFRDYLVWLDSLYEALEEKTITGLPDSLEGKCEQEGTPTPTNPVPINITTGRQVVRVSGKNLLPNNQTTQTINGLTFTINNDKSVSISGTATANTDYYFVGTQSQYIDLGLATRDYYLSGCTGGYGNSYMLYCVLNRNGTLYYYQNFDDARKIIVQSGDTFRIFIRVMNGTTMNTTIYPMLSKDITTYEEYKGNDYEINLGKNLLPINIESGTEKNGITITKNEDGSYTLNGTSTANTTWNLYTGENITIPAGTYTGSIVGRTNIIDGYIRLNNGAYQTIFNNTSDTNTFTINEPFTFNRFYIYISSNKTFNNQIIKLQLEKGQPTSYTPYKTPIYLGKIENYKDYIFKNTTENPLYDSNLEEGQWYIHKEIGRVVLNGSENNWVESVSDLGWNAFTFSYSVDTILNANAYSNYFKCMPSLSDWKQLQNSQAFIGRNKRQMIFRNDSVSGLANWKTWLSSHNVEVYYVLNTPTNTLIEDEELINQLNEIEIFTVISEDFYN